MTAPRRLDLTDVLVAPTVVLLVFFLAPLDRNPTLGAAMSLLSLAALVPIVVRRIGRIQVTDRPVQEAIRAIALIVTVLVIGFATAYVVIAEHTDGQFDDIRTRIDALYFTVTTLVTVGFGDIAPTGQAARALVTVNMVVNVLVLGLFLRLVSWAAKQRIDETGIAHRDRDAS